MHTDETKIPARMEPPPALGENTPAALSVYCLFCKTGREEAVVNTLRKNGLACLIAYASRIVVRDGAELREKRRLLPGYVFIEADERALGANILRVNQDSLRLLCYEYNEYALRGKDLLFYQWLKKRGGAIDVSRVLQVGDRIQVIDGPLKALEGRIVDVNKKRRCVAISLGEGSLMQKIWCSVEYVEQTTDD